MSSLDKLMLSLQQEAVARKECLLHFLVLAIVYLGLLFGFAFFHGINYTGVGRTLEVQRNAFLLRM